MYYHIFDMCKISLLNTHMHTHKTESLTLVYFSPYVKLMNKCTSLLPERNFPAAVLRASVYLQVKLNEIAVCFIHTSI